MGGVVHLPMGLMWSMPVPVACSLAVAISDAGGGGLAVSCGQCPLDDAGRVLGPDDPVAQAAQVAKLCAGVLAHLPAGHQAALLVVYHTAEAGHAAEAALLAPLARAFPGAVLAPVRLPHFYYPGMRIEVDLYAIAAPPEQLRFTVNGAELTRLEGGPLALVHLTAPDAVAASAVLQAAGLSPDRLLSAQWFGAAAPPEPWVPDPAARVVSRSGVVGLASVMTFAPKPVVAGHTPGGAVLRQAGQFAWISAHADKADLAQAAEAAMDALSLADLPGLTMVKATTHYAGGPGPEDLHGNLAVRHARFPNPGPASTGVPVAGLAGATLAIDMLAAILQGA
jgi:enamine deaminase RidA (YjgF/YER057c/UK114 family)